ncbi:Uncharacterised protein [Mycobacteroides abscessus subsp. bolletii]|nr:Uncharacterised protein [Mycobacteroides abscessus subsp. bolletii]SII68687.1 Uncharacterised protein [Mycobacteroides abscessus subsp. bolletii]SKS55975.1 Uncharacterised protein [Mycobacteroides abscessus subsp. bolletii]SKT04184.1 Uncharacterised protein [Mycobacteroides abscessus subsp. bolletii]SLD18316.1 Uncharacterised protein [Mycobacteroides abscessus subsp. bolletii]
MIGPIAPALKFVQTNAHYHYHDQPETFWRGQTAVDCAAQIIAERASTATVFTMPGTVSWWNDGPPAWTAWNFPSLAPARGERAGTPHTVALSIDGAIDKPPSELPKRCYP